MRDNLKATYRRLLKSIDFSYHRYLFDDFNLKSRLTGLVGPRGSGKTTLLLQYIKEKMPDKSQCIYLSLDHTYFTTADLIEFVDDLYEIDGIRFFFFDEVHKYPNWNQVLKNIYDAYPDARIVFSGSSSIDLVKGTYDLSRRGKLFYLGGMSFREYLVFRLGREVPVVSFDELINNSESFVRKIEDIPRIKGFFAEYINCGYYPFLFEDEENYHQKIINVINKTIYEDISNFYKLKTENLNNFRRIVSYLTTIPPGQLNRNSIAKHIGLDNKTIVNYLNILNATGLACLIKENKSGSSLLKGTEKIYLDNSNIYRAVANDLGFDCKIGTLREIFFIKMLQNIGKTVFYSKIGDFHVSGYNFEVGGKNKSRKQIKSHLQSSFLVKDGILYPEQGVIPLHLFGFLY